MNELIENYAIDCAGQMVWDFPKDPEEFTFTRDELAKFAQLIVEECADICFLNRHYSGSELSYMIKRQLGVE